MSIPVSVSVDREPCTIELYDTAGQAEYESLRSIAYTRTDVFVVCYSVVQPSSMVSACDKWLRELGQLHPRVPVVLVGTQTDMRENAQCVGRLLSKGQRPLTTLQGEATAKRVGASAYVECSAVSQSGMKDVFDAAILAAFGLDVPRRSGSRQKDKSHLKPWRCALTGIAKLGKRLVCSRS